MLSNNLIEKSEEKIVIDNKSVYWRDSFVVAILHEQLYLMVAALPYYPKDSSTLYFDESKYPNKQIIEALESKYGLHGIDKYRPPARLRIDVLDEAKPRNLDELHQLVDDCKRRMDARIYAANWERDFSQARHHAICLAGDRAYFKSLAESALDEGRVQVSSEVKALLSREENSMIGFGICVSALDTLNPYRSGGGSGRGYTKAEEGLASSYV